MWQNVARVSDVPEGAGKIVQCAGPTLALFKISGKIFALENACVHRGGPLGEGVLDGSRVTCPWHAWEFDVRTGVCDTAPACPQKTYPVKVQKETIWVDF